MSADARFEDGTENPLRLAAISADDLSVISALIQDAVTQAGDTAWMPKRHRFDLLLNRFRWEDARNAKAQGRNFERVRSVLSFSGILGVRADGINPSDKDTILSLLSIRFDPGEDGTGKHILTFAGDGEIALDAECIDVSLTDVTRPHIAHSGIVPHHTRD